MKILAKTFRFDKGQLQVILLPSMPQEKEACDEMGQCIQGKEGEFCLCSKYNEAVAYARAHPIPVPSEKDVQMIKDLCWAKDGCLIGKNWEPADLTEYKIEVRLEIKYQKRPRGDNNNLHWINLLSMEANPNYTYRQIACLMADDKQEVKIEIPEVIQFAVWYSGMEIGKVIKAYQRWKKESKLEDDKQ